MGRTWRREERQYNKKKIKKGQVWDRNKRSIKEDDGNKSKQNSREDSAEEYQT